jgi:TRAP-type mannitol/chloroaromatic compound transport system permease large subunit
MMNMGTIIRIRMNIMSLSMSTITTMSMSTTTITTMIMVILTPTTVFSRGFNISSSRTATGINKPRLTQTSQPIAVCGR